MEWKVTNPFMGYICKLNEVTAFTAYFDKNVPLSDPNKVRLSCKLPSIGEYHGHFLNYELAKSKADELLCTWLKKSGLQEISNG